MAKKYTIRNLRKQFPNDEACLEFLFALRYGKGPTCFKCQQETKFYRLKNVPKAYTCTRCGYNLHPLADTIFARSSTPLTLWFHAIFLFSTSKNGVSAKELERHLGVAYNTAWRIARQIRKLFREEGDSQGEFLKGIVEIDETFMGGKIRLGKGVNQYTNKTMVLGALERGGNMRTTIMGGRRRHELVPFIYRNVELESTVYTDDFKAYNRLHRVGYNHDIVKHKQEEWARGKVHTNSIEGFWSQLKRSLHGTYHNVSAKHLQLYVDEFAWRYSHRYDPNPVFLMLLKAASQPIV